mgnify:CR=1 FL=1
MLGGAQFFSVGRIHGGGTTVASAKREPFYPPHSYSGGPGVSPPENFWNRRCSYVCFNSFLSTNTTFKLCDFYEKKYIIVSLDVNIIGNNFKKTLFEACFLITCEVGCCERSEQKKMRKCMLKHLKFSITSLFYLHSSDCLIRRIVWLNEHMHGGFRFFSVFQIRDWSIHKLQVFYHCGWIAASKASRKEKNVKNWLEQNIVYNHVRRVGDQDTQLTPGFRHISFGGGRRRQLERSPVTEVLLQYNRWCAYKKMKLLYVRDVRSNYSLQSTALLG